MPDDIDILRLGCLALSERGDVDFRGAVNFRFTFSEVNAGRSQE